MSPNEDKNKSITRFRTDLDVKIHKYAHVISFYECILDAQILKWSHRRTSEDPSWLLKIKRTVPERKVQ